MKEWGYLQYYSAFYWRIEHSYFYWNSLNIYKRASAQLGNPVRKNPTFENMCLFGLTCQAELGKGWSDWGACFRWTMEKVPNSTRHMIACNLKKKLFAYATVVTLCVIFLNSAITWGRKFIYYLTGQYFTTRFCCRIIPTVQDKKIGHHSCKLCS